MSAAQPKALKDMMMGKKPMSKTAQKRMAEMQKGKAC